MTKKPSDFVSMFLESVGRRQDVDLYLRIFRELPKERFAVVATEPALLRHATFAVVDALRFLSELDLRVTLTLGLLGDGGPERDTVLRELDDAGVPCDAVDVAGDAAEAGGRLRRQLRSNGSALVDLRSLAPAERHVRLSELLPELGTRKLVVLRSRGGLGPHQGGSIALGAGHAVLTQDSGISVINLTTDLVKLVAGDHLLPDEADLVQKLAQLHTSFPQLLTSVTSPFALVQELFTVKGAGTLLKTGSTINRCTNYGQLDVERLLSLMSSTFERTIDPAFVEQPPLGIYLEQSYRGAAVIRAGSGAAYLSKFAVSQVAQGEGIGRDLWEAVTLDHPALYWRASSKNPITEWYARECDGLHRRADWTVYWRGVEPALVPRLIEDASSRPSDFVE